MRIKWMKKQLAVVVIAGLVAGSPGLLWGQDAGPGQAAPGHGPKASGFETDDVNKDGRVSRDEFSGPKEMFAHMDTNGDGFISRDEIGPPPNGQKSDRPKPPEDQSN